MRQFFINRLGKWSKCVVLSGLSTLFLVFVPGNPDAIAQQSSFPQQLPMTPPDASGHRPGDELDRSQKEMMEKMEIKRNATRQQELVKDTDKLLALATELKSEVDKTNKNVLSVDVIKKADEIEKLAKSVKERMRQ